MPTVAPNNNTGSDSEDEDYVPPANVQESDSDESGNEPEVAVTAPPEHGEGDPDERKRKRDALWAEFLASASSTKPPETQPTRMVKIEKRYRFAGEEVIEVVEAPEDSPEAKKWPVVNADLSQHVRTTDFVDAHTEANSNEASPCADFTKSVLNQSESSPSIVPKPGLDKRPGPRKPKTTFAPLPTSKSKKITTLDKSAMDWRAHIQSEQEMGSSLKDELEAHRKAGGYLEKVEFLKRVDERKEDNLDVLKGSKRRKL